MTDRGRAILFWFTICMMVLVGVVAAITVLRACSGPAWEESLPTISPAEVSLRPGDQQQFTVEEGLEVSWDATGGRISESGLFTAGDDPGDYTVTAARPNAQHAARAIVHIVAGRPTVEPIPSPTTAPLPTDTPTVEAFTPSPADPQGDVGSYGTGAPVEAFPGGVDVRAASVGPDLHVVLEPSEGVPVGLIGWADEGDVLLWMALYEAIPDPPAVYSDWLFALDVDGNPETGRPAGTARINPDLGTEAAVGVRYEVDTEEYVPYLLVWDPARESWAEQLGAVRLGLDETRTLIGLALPFETLAQTLGQIADVTIAPEAVKGRAAALSEVEGQAVIDFYPDRPD